MAVVNLRQVIERPRLLRERQHVLAAVVFDLDIAFLDIDVRRPVFAHRSELHQMAIGRQFAQREQQVHRADHVIHLRRNRVLAVDHRIRRRTLLGEMHYRFGLERLYRRSSGTGNR